MQLNNKNGKKYRIVSLVPSKTELLAHLGLDDEVVGITKFCIHPTAWFKNKTRVGGTKHIDISKIIALQPNLVIANKQEIRVWLSDIKTFEDALEMINNLGVLLQVQNKANEIIHQITQSKSAFEIEFEINKLPKISAAYMIWDKPMMVAGGDTYINAMMQLAGFQNVFSHKKRYPTVSQKDLFNQKPDVLLLSSEPFPFKQKHQNLFRLSKSILKNMKPSYLKAKYYW